MVDVNDALPLTERTWPEMLDGSYARIADAGVQQPIRSGFEAYGVLHSYMRYIAESAGCLASDPEDPRLLGEFGSWLLTLANEIRWCAEELGVCRPADEPTSRAGGDDRPTVVCVVGSGGDASQALRARWPEVTGGRVVVLAYSEDGECVPPTERERVGREASIAASIRLADEVLVANHGGRVSDELADLILQALDAGKPIRFTVPFIERGASRWCVGRVDSESARVDLRRILGPPAEAPTTPAA